MTGFDIGLLAWLVLLTVYTLLTTTGDRSDRVRLARQIRSILNRLDEILPVDQGYSRKPINTDTDDFVFGTVKGAVEFHPPSTSRHMFDEQPQVPPEAVTLGNMPSARNLHADPPSAEAAEREDLAHVLAVAIETHHRKVGEAILGHEPFGDVTEYDVDEFTLADRELYETFSEVLGRPLADLPEPPPDPKFDNPDQDGTYPSRALPPTPTTVQVVGPPPLPPESVPGAFRDPGGRVVAPPESAPQPVTPPVTFQPAPVVGPIQPPPSDPGMGVPQGYTPPAPGAPSVALPPRPENMMGGGPGALSAQMAAMNNVDPDSIPEIDPAMPPPSPGAPPPPRRIEAQKQREEEVAAAPRTPQGKPITNSMLAGLSPEQRAQVESLIADS